MFEGAAKAANYDGVCQQLSKLETSHYQLMHENSRLRSEVVDYETESIRVQALLKEGKDKYDRLSVKSYRKIKELMTQKHILETELNTLRIQVQYLDAELTQQISRNGVA